MTKSYVLYKCGPETRLPLAIFTAGDMDEAREAPTWLRHKHPDRPGLVPGPGEFFEILEQGHCTAEEWAQAVAAIGSDVPSRKHS